MNLTELKSQGGIVPAALIPKSVTWRKKDGEELTFSIFVRAQSFGTIERLFAADGDRSRSAKFISESVCLGENGEEALTYEDAFQLDPGLAGAFLSAVHEVNGTGTVAAKN